MPLRVFRGTPASNGRSPPSPSWRSTRRRRVPSWYSCPTAEGAPLLLPRWSSMELLRKQGRAGEDHERVWRSSAAAAAAAAEEAQAAALRLMPSSPPLLQLRS